MGRRLAWRRPRRQQSISLLGVVLAVWLSEGMGLGPGGRSGFGIPRAALLAQDRAEGKEAASPPADSPKPIPKKDHQNLLVYWDAEGRAHPVRTPEDWQRRRVDILGGFQEVAGPLPEKFRQTPLDVQILKTEQTPHYRRVKLSYQPEPGDRVPAWLLIPTQGKGRTAAMLCLHQTTRIGKDEPAGLGGSPALHYADELAQLGFVCLVPRLSFVR
jgi:hypothetical protein